MRLGVSPSQNRARKSIQRVCFGLGRTFVRRDRIWPSLAPPSLYPLIITFNRQKRARPWLQSLASKSWRRPPCREAEGSADSSSAFAPRNVPSVVLIAVVLLIARRRLGPAEVAARPGILGRRGAAAPSEPVGGGVDGEEEAEADEEGSEHLELRVEEGDEGLEVRLQRRLQPERGERVDAAHEREARVAAVARARDAARALGLAEDTHQLEDEVEEDEGAAVERVVLRERAV